MTVLVHRPTRSTLPVAEPEPETLAAPPPVVSEAGGFPLQFLLPMVGAMSSVIMMVVMRNGQPLFLLIAGVIFVLALVAGLGFALSSRGRKAAEQAAQRTRYLDYLERVRRDLQTRTAAVRDAASLLHPDPEALISLVRDPGRLWERRRSDADPVGPLGSHRRRDAAQASRRFRFTRGDLRCGTSRGPWGRRQQGRGQAEAEAAGVGRGRRGDPAMRAGRTPRQAGRAAARRASAAPRRNPCIIGGPTSEVVRP